MKPPRFLTLLASLLVFASAGIRAADAEWTSMFNGKDLAGWKSNDETPGVFYVINGLLKVNGGRAHLFYAGPDGDANFTNFEFKAKVLTTPGSNSGIYFHTKYEDKGWPFAGFECQVNSTHTDRKKTGGLYGVKDVNDNAPSRDFEWCDYGVKVVGKHVTVTINGQITADWTQPGDWDPKVSLKNMDGRKLGSGTIALQGHDPKSTTFYKDIFIRPLP
jgi:hypothetical protein